MRKVKHENEIRLKLKLELLTFSHIEWYIYMAVRKRLNIIWRVINEVYKSVYYLLGLPSFPISTKNDKHKTLFLKCQVVFTQITFSSVNVSNWYIKYLSLCLLL